MESGRYSARVAALSSGVIHATMFTPPSDMISEKAGMRVLAKIDVANIGGGLNTTVASLQRQRPQVLRFLRGYMEAIHQPFTFSRNPFFLISSRTLPSSTRSVSGVWPLALGLVFAVSAITNSRPLRSGSVSTPSPCLVR